MAKRRSAKGLTTGNPCLGCGSLCCRYFAVFVDEPTDLDDYEALKWYLHHRKVCVYVDRENDWYVHVEVPCRQLEPGGACRIYEDRPSICRDYSHEGCERADDGAENIAEFNSAEEFEAFFRLNFRVAGRKLRRLHRTYRTVAAGPAAAGPPSRGRGGSAGPGRARKPGG